MSSPESLLYAPQVCSKISKAVNNVKENYNNKIYIFVREMENHKRSEFYRRNIGPELRNLEPSKIRIEFEPSRFTYNIINFYMYSCQMFKLDQHMPRLQT